LVIEALELWTASVTANLIRAFGEEVTRKSTVLVHPSGFGYEIYYPCTALFPAFFLAAALLLTPSARATRIWTLPTGIALVTALNFGRLVSLFFIGVHEPEMFSLAHDVLWQTALVGFIAGYWAVCRRPVRVYNAINDGNRFLRDARARSGGRLPSPESGAIVRAGRGDREVRGRCA
jgi:exosortase/archaeosortase family protein